MVNQQVTKLSTHEFYDRSRALYKTEHVHVHMHVICMSTGMLGVKIDSDFNTNKTMALFRYHSTHTSYLPNWFSIGFEILPHLAAVPHVRKEWFVWRLRLLDRLEGRDDVIMM